MVLLIAIACLLIGLTIFLIPQQIFGYFFTENISFIIVTKCSLALFFYCLTILNTEYIRAKDKVNLSELFRGVIKYSPLLIVAVLLYVFDRQDLIVNFYLIGFVILALISSIIVYQKKGTASPIKTGLSSILHKSYPMAVSSLGLFLLLSVDVIFIKRYGQFQDVAFYSICMKIILILSTITTTFNAFIAKDIARLYAINESVALQQIIKKYTRIIVFLSLPIIVIALLFPKFILSFFGESYSEASGALVILVIGHFISVTCAIGPMFLNMTGKQRVFQYILMFCVVLNIILNSLLIPEFGLNGAAIASSISTVFWSIASALIIYKKDKIKIAIH